MPAADLELRFWFAVFGPKGMPDDFSPFNIQLLGNRLYVAFAALDVDADEPGTDVPAQGAGHRQGEALPALRQPTTEPP